MAYPTEELATAPTGVALETPLSFSERARAFYELGKPNLSFLVVLTAVLGFYAAPHAADFPWGRLVHLIIGTGLTAMGACALNMYIERDLDPLMKRTRTRPIPSGRVAPEEALAFSMGVFTFGFAELAIFTGPLTAMLALLTGVVYGFAYTPLKRYGPVSVWVGALPGAIPPLMGWAAATGNLSFGGWALFSVLFAWQFPHFLSLAYLYREDYARVGFRFLPADDPKGTKTGRQIAFGTVVLLLASIGPYLAGSMGVVYLVGAVVLGLGFAWAGLRVARQATGRRARQAFFASITYLPLLMALMVLDRVLS